MIIKSFELDKINIKSNSFYLFYGENEGYKNEVIEKIFNINISKNIYRYEEKEILDNFESFYESIQSKSFFEKEKLIIISRVSDKIKNIIEEIIEKNIEDIKIVLNSGILEKKSKLRSLFEKNKNTICVPFYADSIALLGNEDSLTVVTGLSELTNYNIYFVGKWWWTWWTTTRK